MAVRGQWVDPIDDDMKEQFLDLVANGFSRPEAAKALGASARQFRSLCSTDSYRYDEDFARRYAKITETAGEHHTALVERLQEAAIERGIRSSDRLLEKLLVLYHPDWEIHRPQAPQLNFKADEMRIMFAGLSDETLQKMLMELENKKQGEIGPPDIDA